MIKGIPRNTEITPIIVEFAKLLKPSTYVEIGVKNGYTFNQISCFVDRAVAVDINPMRSLNERPGVEKYQMSSQEFFSIWKDPIDMMFIDADHRREAVLSDVYGGIKFIRDKSGLMLLHDTHPGCEELMDDGYCSTAWQAASTLWGESVINFMEVLTIPSPWFGLTIIRPRRDGHLSWRG